MIKSIQAERIRMLAFCFHFIIIMRYLLFIHLSVFFTLISAEVLYDSLKTQPLWCGKPYNATHHHEFDDSNVVDFAATPEISPYTYEVGNGTVILHIIRS